MSYINLYNYLQTLLWAAGLIFMLVTFISPDLTQYLNKYFIIIQSVMALDIVHAILRLVRGNIFATILQVGSRIYVVWMIVSQQDSPNIFNYIMYTAWSLAEIIRYQYYIHKPNEGPLLFLRYNSFLILYPMGVLTGEMPLIYQNYQKTNNIVNLVILFLYIPFFPYLYIHMLSLRKKKSQESKKTN